MNCNGSHACCLHTINTLGPLYLINLNSDGRTKTKKGKVAAHRTRVSTHVVTKCEQSTVGRVVRVVHVQKTAECGMASGQAASGASGRNLF